MSVAVKKTISLPPELAHAAEELAQEEGKTLSGVIQDALRSMRSIKLKKELRAIEGYWCKKARQTGVLAEKDLERLLKR